MPDPDPRPLLFQAFDQTARVVGGVSTEQLSLPTPCREFDVTALLTHIVGVGNRVAAVGRGEDQSGALPTPRSVADDGWAEAFADSLRQAQAAWTDDEVLDRKAQLPFGNLPGAMIAGVYTMELTAHAWDLAHATGQVDVLDPELAEAALPIARGMLPPEPRGGFIPFEAVVACPPDASAYDRLATFLGRDIT